MAKSELEKLQSENAALKEEVERLKNEMMRLISHNLDLAQHLEEDVELRRRASVAREIMKVNIEHQRSVMPTCRTTDSCLHLLIFAWSRKAIT